MYINKQFMLKYYVIKIKDFYFILNRNFMFYCIYIINFRFDM